MNTAEEISRLKNQANALKYGVWFVFIIVALLALGGVF